MENITIKLTDITKLGKQHNLLFPQFNTLAVPQTKSIHKARCKGTFSSLQALRLARCLRENKNYDNDTIGFLTLISYLTL